MHNSRTSIRVTSGKKIDHFENKVEIKAFYKMPV